MLQGFCRVKVSSWHLTIDGVAVHSKDGRRWAQLPARPQLNANRELERDADGKIKYSRLLWFDDRELADRFSAAVLEALERFIAVTKRVDEGVF
jgi:hypothetical protein